MAMTSPWQMLIGNLAVVALFVLGWAHARFWLRGIPGPVRAMLFGLAMGAGAIATMLMTAEIAPGRYVDLRNSLVALSSLLGGPLATSVTTIMAIGWRVFMGGSGVVPGVVTIALSSLIGLAVWFGVGQRQTKLWHTVGAGLLLLVIGVLVPYLTQPAEIFWNMLPITGPAAVLNLVATPLSALVILHARRLSGERDLLAAALEQAPDYAYVKDVDSRFALVNLAVTRLHGFEHPEQLRGRTDFDVTDPERARMLFAEERELLRKGQPMWDKEEHLPDRDGTSRWFSTSKVPLYDRAGRPIGIAGVTRDVTTDKQMRRDLIESRDLLSHALAEMSDGLAMFDASGRLVFCNEQYRRSFPYTGAFRQTGAHFSEILRKVIDTGEQLSVPADDAEGWIARVLANLHRESEEEIALFDGKWLQVRTRPTSNGSTMVVITDVTRIKQAELALQSATDQLQEMARTDALTGLLNRRAFDDMLQNEIRRTSRSESPLSLLLIDVDRFKSYNDRYGHPAGDEALRRVAEQLRLSFKRVSDLPARYGGEEFAAILPDTDEDGAYLVAEAFRKGLADLRLPHEGSERQHVTASIGVATYMSDNLHRSATEIIGVADEMLYGAKAAGRDRVLGTRINAKTRRYGS
jgi:diguanylate cyclase (GGDEF)-like protein/PAS domain S-box-containing protein